MKILRSIGAVLAGFVAVVVLSVGTDAVLEGTGVFPPPDKPELMTASLLMVALAYRTVYTIVGGYVTAWLAASKPVTHAIVLGALGMVVGSLGAVLMWKLGNTWYAIALVVEAIPCTWLGARLRMRS